MRIKYHQFTFLALFKPPVEGRRFGTGWNQYYGGPVFAEWTYFVKFSDFKDAYDTICSFEIPSSFLTWIWVGNISCTSRKCVMTRIREKSD